MVCITWHKNMDTTQHNRAATGKAADDKMSLGEKMLAGAFSALPATALMAPVERIKCLLQIQGEEVRS